ncbi:MAG: type II toxin-antitoxin system VapC family toxin [bacterium]|nr:type II toxin-antitoxin system VapC family toxin [bacterium]
MIFLDTHIVVWLYEGLVGKLTEKSKDAIENNDLYISQFVRLEMQYLYEIKRITEK